ncbi:MAG: low specificity L-threonine aldolase [Alphaproteobacteria bacterium]|nr:low specificity L-threonine aldolase [Alphaproteobacteria bacterium]
MKFASDNIAGVHPKIVAALAAASGGVAMPYGSDDWTRRVEKRISEIFERDCAVALVGTGTAANSLALAVGTPSWGAIYCHPGAHVLVDECNAPEFYTGGAKLVTVDGPAGKLTAAGLAAALPKGDASRGVHHPQPAAVSLSQAAETGTVYSVAEMGAIGEVAKGRGLWLHVDGARFANAVASTGASPAALTWKAGVDVLSFGATKNGALAAEAIVLFDKAKAWELQLRRKRAGQLWSKMRFLAAQMEAYLADDLWLANARNANAMAARLANGLAAIAGTRLEHKVEANEIFITIPEPMLAGLERAGFPLLRWNGPGTQLVRLVCAFDSTAAEVDALIAAAQAQSRAAAE